MKSEKENEVLAVISAVLASLSSKEVKLAMKSFKRVGQRSPIWNVTGRLENLRQY